MKSFNKILMLIIFGIASNAHADNLLIENNFDVVVKDSEVKAFKQDLVNNKSSFFPELNLVTGIGSEYTRDKTETEKGGVLYLDSKINFFNGYKDLNNQRIIEEKINKTLLEKEIALRKVKTSLVRLIEEKRVLRKTLQLLIAEININQGQEMMAQKKVQAGLNSEAELLDFQIKEANLKNEISLLEMNIQQKDSELLLLVGNSMKIETIEKDIPNELSDDLKMPSQDLELENKVLISDLKVAELEVSKSKSSYSPKIDLEAKAGKITPTSHLFKDKSEHQIALNLTIPLYSGFSSNAEVQKTINERFIKESALKNFNANFESQINIERKKIELNKKLLRSNEQILNKAIKFYSQCLVEYRRGIKNSTDIISASDRVLELRRKTIELSSQIKVDVYAFNKRFEN